MGNFCPVPCPLPAPESGLLLPAPAPPGEWALPAAKIKNTTRRSTLWGAQRSAGPPPRPPPPPPGGPARPGSARRPARGARPPGGGARGTARRGAPRDKVCLLGGWAGGGEARPGSEGRSGAGGGGHAGGGRRPGDARRGGQHTPTPGGPTRAGPPRRHQPGPAPGPRGRTGAGWGREGSVHGNRRVRPPGAARSSGRPAAGAAAPLRSGLARPAAAALPPARRGPGRPAAAAGGGGRGAAPAPGGPRRQRGGRASRGGGGRSAPRAPRRPAAGGKEAGAYLTRLGARSIPLGRRRTQPSRPAGDNDVPPSGHRRRRLRVSAAPAAPRRAARGRAEAASARAAAQGPSRKRRGAQLTGRRAREGRGGAGAGGAGRAGAGLSARGAGGRACVTAAPGAARSALIGGAAAARGPPRSGRRRPRARDAPCVSAPGAGRPRRCPPNGRGEASCVRFPAGPGPRRAGPPREAEVIVPEPGTRPEPSVPRSLGATKPARLPGAGSGYLRRPPPRVPQRTKRLVLASLRRHDRRLPGGALLALGPWT